MKSLRNYSIGLIDGKAVIVTEDPEVARRLLETIYMPTYLHEESDTVLDIRDIKSITVTIQLEGDIQRIKLKKPATK
ncbi:hypothetical protein [Thermosipho sp. 1074]|uniref:hypothetical protein n=1 Tax=Thermosipho sp. 1074 TaxID=1643331 RepID=UPI000987C520|nr:hypothetical protein [Thermosipho sp. 1074]OOC42177.1 hypothetical protein XO08_07790 [Thermosipho sp. 1074]